MVLERAPDQIPVAGDVHQDAPGVPPPQLLSQPEAVPLPVLQIHVQEVDALPAVLCRLQQLLPAAGAVRHLHVVVLHKDLPLQGGPDLVADRVLIVTEVNLYHHLASTVSSCTNTPLSQLVQEEALG